MFLPLFIKAIVNGKWRKIANEAHTLQTFLVKKQTKNKNTRKEKKKAGREEIPFQETFYNLGINF